MSYSVRVVHDVGAVDCREWAALSARPPAAIAGSRPWVDAAFAVVHPEAKPWLVALERDGRLVGLLALALHEGTGRPTLRIAGAPLNDLADVMVLPGHERPAGRAAVEELERLAAGGYAFALDDLDPAGVLAAARGGGGALSWTPGGKAPAVDLGGDWSTAPSVRRRRQWDRRMRRLSEAHTVAFATIEGLEVVDAHPEFARLRAAWLRGKPPADDLPPEAFVERVVAALAPAGECCFVDLRVNGAPVARDLYLVRRPRALMWLRAVSPEWQHYPCGHLLLRHSQRMFADAGFEVLDLGRGDEPYKAVFGGDRRVLLQVRDR